MSATAESEWRLDPDARELRRGGRRLRLQGQTFALLQALLERPGEVITRDELQRRLWPDDRFVDCEHGLNAAVKRLRTALDDDAGAQRLVQTLPGNGYRLRLPPSCGVTAAGAAQTPPVRLAVLPFASLSDASGRDMFSDGLTEELIAQLAGFRGRGIGVIGRWSSETFGVAPPRVRAIGEALGANYLLEGGVRHDRYRVRVTARLVDAGDETYRWSDSYEHRLHKGASATIDPVTIQIEVAARVAHAVAQTLAPSAPAD